MTDDCPVFSYDAPIHVLDLPQLYTRPSAPILFDTLTKLTIKATAWSSESEKCSKGPDSTVAIDEDGIPQYLTSIIASQLRWIEDEHVREQVWEMASARLSERSGRTANLPLPNSPPNPNPHLHHPSSPTTPNPLNTSPPNPLHITLHEPTLTADNLGHKTWLSSYLLARRLPTLLNSYLLPPPHSPPLRILELGSGTGLLGLTAAFLLPRAKVHLTDLPPILANLTKNVRLNNFPPDHNMPEVRELDWSAPPAHSHSNGDGGNTQEGGGEENSIPLPQDDSPNSPIAEKGGKYDLILSSDPLYSPSHPAWLVRTILSHLAPPHPQAQPPIVVIELPLRTAYLPQVHELRDRLREGGLELLEQGEEVGWEDWGGGGGGGGGGGVGWGGRSGGDDEGDGRGMGGGGEVLVGVWGWGR
ncbi:NADH-cytochrome b5 reductase [Physcia stellaris]|nr:NADH-cytochrome b5 reductase [Physcia stellaris]